MKKISALVAALALAAFCSAAASAATLEDLDKRITGIESKTVLSMNVRWFYADDSMGHIVFSPNNAARNDFNQWSLHAVEIAAKQEYQKVGAQLIYRFSNGNDYLVNAYGYYKNGAHLVKLGQFFTPFGLYEWTDLSLYHPLLSVPGALGYVWDFDWGLGYTYTGSINNDNPVKIDLAYMFNDESRGAQMDGNVLAAGVRPAQADEKNTITGRVSVDVVRHDDVNWNLALSYMNGKLQGAASDGSGDDADKSVWAIDTAVKWGKVNIASIRGEYADYREAFNMRNGVSDGKFGLIQAQYDIMKVHAPFNKVSLILCYSYDDPEGANNLTTDMQEEIVVQLAKNLSVFAQFDQVEQDTGVNTSEKIHRSSLWFKYNLF